MTALQKVEAPETAVANYSASLIDVIARAASDPAVDIDKMERLIALQQQVSAREAELAFNQAMNAAQAEMRPISANASNPQTKSRYATFDKLDRALRPIYTAHGFSLSFDEGDSPKPEHVRVLCYVAHTAGHTRTYHRDMPADGKGAKGGDVMTKTHAAGAAGSYGARYLLKGIWNVAVGAEDDDGNLGPRREAPKTIGEKDIDDIETIMTSNNIPIADLLKVAKVADVAEIRADRLTSVKNWIDRQVKARGIQ
ncbi:ERF family protein [Sphingopyxis sp. BSN-002]|uniref:ERF family protein n=1 Tax=Sphingopyxis sp. BSN-002 TaxID=2911495 RepID=UPI001EDB5095|nr:ERF family protein [Sphingopyxis sp. BSN-002]QVJ07670.1 ERF superfamily protein [Sphingopyxis phage VSN-002]UKK84721.1 ERF family protein [Sphingopyxis sp. BSN-002]